MIPGEFIEEETVPIRNVVDRALPAQAALVLDGFRRITKALRQTAAETQARSGISAAQLFVLESLRPGCTYSINELAQLTHTDRSSVAAIIDKLAAGKYVRRSWSPADRRRAEISITRAGRLLVSRAGDAPTVRLLTSLAQLAPAELDGLAEGLSRLQAAMGIADERAAMLFED